MFLMIEDGILKEVLKLLGLLVLKTVRNYAGVSILVFFCVLMSSFLLALECS